MPEEAQPLDPSVRLKPHTHGDTMELTPVLLIGGTFDGSHLVFFTQDVSPKDEFDVPLQGTEHAEKYVVHQIWIRRCVEGHEHPRAIAHHVPPYER